MQQIWEDNELGRVVLRKNWRSRHYTIRLRRGAVSVSLPLYGSYKQAIRFVEEHRFNLLQKLNTQKQKNIPPDNELELRKKAKAFLPGRLEVLALQHGFTYTAVRITKSKTRWGSCSSRGSINLSLYLMLLSPHLIDYVLLHELCHTRYMNHGSAFWQLLDSLCEGKSQTLRHELKLITK